MCADAITCGSKVAMQERIPKKGRAEDEGREERRDER